MKRLLLIAASAVLAYLPGLGDGWHYDDRVAVQDNTAVRDLARAGKEMLRGGGRSFTTLSFALNRRIGLDAWSYRLPNVACHAANAYLVYALALALGAGTWGGLAAGLFFALHPLQTQAVTYIAQRSTALVTLCYLGSVLAYLRWRSSPSGRTAGWFLLATGFCAILGALCKENILTLPLTLLALEIVLPAPVVGRRRPWGFLASAAGASLVLVQHWAATGQIVTLAEMQSRTESIGLSSWSYLRLQCQAHLIYLRMIVLPFHQSLIHGPLRLGTVVPEVTGGIVLGGMLVWSLLARRAPLLRLGVLWWLSTQALESSFIVIQHPIFEHRCYLPLAGLALAAGWLADRLVPLGGGWFRIGAAILAILSFLTAARQQAWRDDETLARDALRVAPRDLTSNSLAGERFLAQGRYELSHVWFERALRCPVVPRYQRTRIMLINANAYTSEGRPERALPTLIRMEDHLGMSRALTVLGRFDEAEREMALADLRDPLNSAVYQALRWRGPGREGVLAAFPAYARTPSAEHAARLGTALLKAGAVQEAVDFLDESAARHPDSAEVFLALGVALSEGDQLQEACRVFEHAIAKRPSAPLWNNLGVARSRMGDSAGAAEAFRKALALDPGYAPARRNLDALPR